MLLTKQLQWRLDNRRVATGVMCVWLCILMEGMFTGNLFTICFEISYTQNVRQFPCTLSSLFLSFHIYWNHLQMQLDTFHALVPYLRFLETKKRMPFLCIFCVLSDGRYVSPSRIQPFRLVWHIWRICIHIWTCIGTENNEKKQNSEFEWNVPIFEWWNIW